MLFQPTNLSPDVIGGIGNGTVDATEDLVISWQVNGNEPMTAYRIRIYANDADSTLKYNGTKHTLANPFSGVDYKGDIQLYSSTIPAADLATAGITNGNEYKYILTLYWGTGGAEYIYQRSASVFITRANPTVSVTVTDSTTYQGHESIGTRDISATGAYSQAQGDAIEWVRWRLFGTISALDPDDNVTLTIIPDAIYDTGKIYGTSDLRMYYDGLLNNEYYIIYMDLMTENGVTTHYEKSILVHWNESVIWREVKACKLNRQSTAVKVAWEYDGGIMGRVSGSTTIRNNVLKINNPSSYVYWNDNNGTPLSLEDPWTLVMETTLLPNVGNSGILYITTDGTVSPALRYSDANKTLTCVGSDDGNGNEAVIQNVPNDAHITVVISSTPITPTGLSTARQFFVRVEYEAAATLMPSATLKPSATLTPAERETNYVLGYMYNGGTYGNITEIKVQGAQVVDYIQVVGQDAGDAGRKNIVLHAIQRGDYSPKNTDVARGTTFFADFKDGLSAGQLFINGTLVTGWAIYRQKATEQQSVHLVDVPTETLSILDYGCGSGEGNYEYSLYPIGDGKYLASKVTSEPINPIFENWSVIEAELMDDGYYNVLNEYIFGKNLSSGSVSNNNSPSVSQNFTRYPTVQMSCANYQSGTLGSLIGHIGYFSYIVQVGDTLDLIAKRFKTTIWDILNANPAVSEDAPPEPGQVIKVFYPDGQVEYRDDKKLRDAIWALSTSRNTLFLKSRKGDVIEIKIAGAISMSADDKTVAQELMVSIPWVQVGDATHARIIGG